MPIKLERWLYNTINTIALLVIPGLPEYAEMTLQKISLPLCAAPIKIKKKSFPPVKKSLLFGIKNHSRAFKDPLPTSARASNV